MLFVKRKSRDSYKSIPSSTSETTTFDESFTPKSKLFNKTVFKKPSERLGRSWTDGHVILYECTALTS